MSRAHVLSDWEIEKRYQKATNKCNEIKIMSELEDCTEDEIREVLKDRGIEPEVKKKIGLPRIEVPQPRQPKKRICVCMSWVWVLQKEHLSPSLVRMIS
jgi:hypothetical protein